MAGVCASFELMNAEEICDWLKNSSGKPFEEYILSAIKGNLHFNYNYNNNVLSFIFFFFKIMTWMVKHLPPHLGRGQNP